MVSNVEEPDTRPTVSAGDARVFVARAARFVEMPEADVDLFVDGLVEADLRGVTSHGIVRIPPYIRALAKGVVNPRPEVKVLREFGANSSATPRSSLLAANATTGHHNHGVEFPP